MRKEFSEWIEAFGSRDTRLIFLTGDLGFGALEKVQAGMGARFINMGVSEQNMVAVAAGLARQGLLPLCYSIAPFAVFRPLEQIRLDVALHALPVKIVGNGGGYGYGIMGASHHALEDLAVLSCLPNFSCIVPLCDEDVVGACEALFRHRGPAYLRLGLGKWPDQVGALPAFDAIRSLVNVPDRPKLTIAGIGPVLLNTLPWIVDCGKADVFAISQLPIPAPTEKLMQSVKISGRLLVIEEHTGRGGMGEHLSTALSRAGIPFKLHHCHAAGYPDGRYGSQRYHQQQSGLDAISLQSTVAALLS